MNEFLCWCLLEGILKKIVRGFFFFISVSMKNRQIRCGVDVQSCPEEGEFKFRIRSLTLPTSFSHQWKWFSYSYMVLNIKHFILFFRTSFRLWLGVVTCQYIPSSSQAEQCSRDSRLWVIDHHWFPWHFQSFRAGAVEGLWAGRGVRSLTNSLKQHAGWFIIVDVPKLAAVTRLLRYWKLVILNAQSHWSAFSGSPFLFVANESGVYLIRGLRSPTIVRLSALATPVDDNRRQSITTTALSHRPRRRCGWGRSYWFGTTANN